MCKVDLKLEQFARDNVELVPDTMELLTDTELTQYYIQTWSLDYNEHGDKINILLLQAHQLQIFYLKKFHPVV